MWVTESLWTRYMSHDILFIKSTVLTFLSSHVTSMLGTDGASGAKAGGGGGVCTLHLQQNSSCPAHVHAQPSSFLQDSSTYIWLTGWRHDMDTLYTHYWLLVRGIDRLPVDFHHKVPPCQYILHQVNCTHFFSTIETGLILGVWGWRIRG